MMGGRCFLFCSSVPNSMRIGPMWLSPCTGRCGAPMRASSSVMMICSLRLAPIPPYCLGQCGAIQPLRDTVRYQGINSAGGGRVLRPRNAAGRLASSHVRTSWRNAASAGLSRRNMTTSFHLDVGGGHDACPQRTLLIEKLAELVRGADVDFSAQIVEPCARVGL